MTKKIYITACLMLAVFLTVDSQATTISIGELALWSGGSIGLGSNVSVDAAIAAGSNISAGSSANLRSTYSDGKITLGSDAAVSGSVLANKQVIAGSGLHLSGNVTGSSVLIGSKADIVGDVGARTSLIVIGSNSSITGDVLGNKHIIIGSGSTVTGDAMPGIGCRLLKGSNVTITGLTQPGSFSFDSFDLPELDVLQTPQTGSTNIYGEKDSITTLLPDEYRDWSFDKNTTLNLSAGQYSLGNFSISKDSVVNIDTSDGDVVLNIIGRFTTATGVSFLKSGSGSLYINVFNHDTSIGSNSNLTAIVKVFGGDFSADSNVRLAGRFYATGNICLGSNTQVQYISPFLQVPEPSTLAIFAAMGLFLPFRRS